MDCVIKTEDIRKTYSMGEVEVKALDGVSVTIGKGEMLSITGPSGSGKSTLMNIIGCLDVPTSGRIEIDGVCTSGLGERDLSLIRGRKVGFVFQQYNLLSYLTVIENVALPLVYQNVGEKERFSRAAAALEQVGLSDRLRHLPRELSGGQKQRTAIARSIVANPSIILADEPTGALDSRTGLEIMALFKKLNSNGATIIIVTHDNSIAEMCGRSIRIRDGRVSG